MTFTSPSGKRPGGEPEALQGTWDQTQPEPPGMHSVAPSAAAVFDETGLSHQAIAAGHPSTGTGSPQNAAHSGGSSPPAPIAAPVPVIDYAAFEKRAKEVNAASDAEWRVPQQVALPSGTQQVALPQLQPPPGRAGVLAQFIYNAAPRPVLEVAVATALAILAGVCGKAYVTTSRSGLNLYLILIARSAVGKEAMHSGISILLSAARRTAPTVGEFFSFDELASGQALTKAVAANPCFVNVAGEIGHKLKAMAASSNRPDSPMQSLRRTITHLYQKSGPQSMTGGIRYSDAEKDVATVEGAAFSMIGETTPGTFYESLTPAMMEDGFMSRFLVIQYEGERPNENKHVLHQPDDDLLAWFKWLTDSASWIVQQPQGTLTVQAHLEAAGILDAFNVECDDEIRQAGDDESRRQMWNRAHLKAWKVAALLAVADGVSPPVITTLHVQWSIALIRRDIATFTRRLLGGDIGLDDKARQDKVLAITRQYLSAPLSQGYSKFPPAMREVGIIPRAFLQQRTSSLPSFTSHRLGATEALDRTLRSLCDNGWFREIKDADLFEKFRFHGKCFRVLNVEG